MTDIFISYAHEDQPFVRGMVPALEAEGFSVWWDHTIPPGKSWDTFIAKGIAEARCCIVVWSKHSVASDWVKEEATLAKDAGKLLPIQIGNVEPPVGFRRIQAANLHGWSGDRYDAQWQMLVREARATVEAARGRTDASQPPTRPSRAPIGPARRPPYVLLGALGLAAVAVLTFVVLSSADTRSRVTQSSTPSVSTQEALVEDPEEIERLRRERDQAIAASNAQRLENERLQREEEERVERERQAAAAEAARQAAIIGGTWRGGINWTGHGHFNAEWRFLAGGVAESPGVTNGTWRWEGEWLQIHGTDSNGARIDYRGRVIGSVFSGRALASYETETFRGTFEFRQSN